MADVQLAVIDQQNTEIVAAVPGIQGPAGVVGYFDVSGATYTLTSANRSKIGRFTSSSAVTVTIPAGLIAGFDCMILQLGTGQITFTAGAGVTLRSALSASKTAYRYAAASLIAIGTDEYLLTGEVTA